MADCLYRHALDGGTLCVSCCSLLLFVGSCCARGQRENCVCAAVLDIAWAWFGSRATGTAVQLRRLLFANIGWLDVGFLRVSCCSLM